MKPQFSICIPNFNYGDYIGITLQSVVNQKVENIEILIADNASTDNSVAVIDSFAKKDNRIRYQINPSNIGFAGNLDEVGRIAKGEWMIMLSSDDVMLSDAISEYQKFIQAIPIGESFAFCSTFEKIDSHGKFLNYISAKNSRVWYSSDIDTGLSKIMGYNVYKVPSNELFKRCLSYFLNPFNFASTCYPKSVYEKVGGYGGGRMYNPDKWFHWKILSQLDYAYYLDKPLFQYRWHHNNQASLQNQTGVLRFWVDEYRNSFEPDENMLKNTGLSRDDIIDLYCLSILKFIYYALKRRQLLHAVRLWHWANACYPRQIKRQKYFWLLQMPIQLAKILC